jgi:hypothetical protein
MATYQEPPGFEMLSPADEADEPPLPDEARARAAGALGAPTAPVEAGGRILHIRFRGRESQLMLDAMRTFRELIRQRPGETPVLVHIEVSGRTALPIPLRPVAYDGDLIAEIHRRLGAGTVDVSLA